MFRTQATAFGTVKEAQLGRGGEIAFDGRALIGVGFQNEADDGKGIVAAGDEFMCQPVEEFRMTWHLAFPIMNGFDKARPHESIPDTIDDDAGEAAVFR